MVQCQSPLHPDSLHGHTVVERTLISQDSLLKKGQLPNCIEEISFSSSTQNVALLLPQAEFWEGMEMGLKKSSAHILSSHCNNYSLVVSNS